VKRTPNVHPGRITHFAFSPDGARVAFVSSHEAGCTAYVRDLGSTCPEALYVASAVHQDPLRLVRSGFQMAGRPWWIR
jgi:Tol biopolymer transport system component